MRRWIVAVSMVAVSISVAVLMGTAAMQAQALPLACSALRGRTIAAIEIGLPTRGVVVSSAKVERGAGGGFCVVKGQVHSVDVAAMPIRFEVDLPEKWNGRAVQFGGGAFNGYMPAVREETVFGDKRAPTPLARGYATFGSDSGHHHHYLLLPDRYNALKADFAMNDEQRKNFASDGLKKTHDVAIALMKLRYGSAPKRMYFVGGSTGGREAMKLVDRFPNDYDGVLAAYAAWNQIESDLQFIRVSQAQYSPGGWLASSKTKLLRNAVMQACDAADGLVDGMVSDPAHCNWKAETLRCADGKDHRGCLSDGELRTVAAFATPQVSNFSVENGMNNEPGYNVLRGADLTGNMGALKHAFKPSLPLLNSFYYVVGDGVLRYFLGHGRFDTLGFDVKTGRASDGTDWVPAIRKQSGEDDGSLADLSPFAAHGGKLLLVHGTADATIPTDASVLLYERIVSAMGQQRADTFLRLYLVPGMGHGRGVFYAGFDTVGVLDAWADGTAPGDLVVSDQNKGAARTRPMCVWPRWPKYMVGDANAAASFACVER